jgi:hypothetical protein
MILQILLGGIAGVSVLLRLGWRRIAARSAIRFSRQKSDSDTVSMTSTDANDQDEVVVEPPVRRAA